MSLTQSLNRWAESFWPDLVRMTWQGLIIAGVVAVLLVLFRKSNAPWRRALVLLALVKFVVPPWWASPLGVFSWLVPAQPAQRLKAGVAAESLNLPAQLGLYIAVGATAILLYAGVEYIQIRWTIARARRIASTSTLHTAEFVAAQLELTTPRLLTSSGYARPRAGGRLRPYIFLPPWCLALHPRDLTALLAHQMAHLKRHDPWLKPLQVLVQALHWWNPVVWWLSGRLRAEQELCCDDFVLDSGLADPAWYTSMLVDVADGAGGTNLTDQMLGLHEPVRPLKRRILRGLDATADRRPRLRPRQWLALIVLSVIVLPGAPWRDGSDHRNLLRRYRYPPTAQASINERSTTSAKTAVPQVTPRR